MSHTYKNITDQELEVIGVGIVGAGKTITTDQPISNPNLEAVKKESKK